MHDHIKAKVFSIKDGYYETDNLKLIRILSKDYNLAIMEDYLPIIGEVEGNVLLKGDNFEKRYDNINGFYKCSHNEFELIIKSEKIERAS